MAFIDEKLKNNGAAKMCVDNKHPSVLMRLAAQACIGVREEGGNNRGPIVSLIQDTVGGPDPWPWCMSFVQTCIAYAEIKTGIESRFPVTEHCMTAWHAAKDADKTEVFPWAGDVAIWNYAGTDKGHTGIVDTVFVDRMLTIEGNTSSGKYVDGKVVREGDGIYFMNRRLKSGDVMQLVGFISPFKDKFGSGY